MNFLLTNDDGIEGEGLITLAHALIKVGHEVTIVAPDCNNSAVSHKINMRGQLSLSNYTEKLGVRAYSFSGTPADCVMFALKVLDVKPQAVLSGINDGMNLGRDCIYSGTVAAAQEGAQNGIPSIAFSTDYKSTKEGYQKAADFILKHLEAWVTLACQAHGALNVNLPTKEEIKGIRICRTANTTYFPEYERIDGENTYQYRFGMPPVIDEGENDARLFRQGFVTLTPLTLDMTDHFLLERWKQ